MQKEKKQNPIAVLFSFAGEAKGRMSLSVFLAVIGEIFGMAPFFAVAVLAGRLYAGTATLGEAALLFGYGSGMYGAARYTVLAIISQKSWGGIYYPKKYPSDGRG